MNTTEIVKTPVEWLVEQLRPSIKLQDKIIDEYLVKALNMEREHTINFTDNYVDNCVIPNEYMAIPTKMDVPQYYEETVGKKLSN